MTTQPTHAPKLVLRDPIQLATSIPYLLGFSPDDSIVLTFANEAGRHILTARNDLPGSDESAGRCALGLESICGRAVLEGATAVAAVFYPAADTSAVTLARLVTGMAIAVPQMGLELLSISSVSEGMWRNELAPDETAINLADAGVATAAEWVARGVSFQDSRSRLADSIRGPQTALAVQVREVIVSAPDSWDRDITRNRQLRRRIEDELVEYLEEFSSSSHEASIRNPVPLPRATELARWAVGLADNRVREPVLWRLAEASGGFSDLDDQRYGRVLDAMTVLLRNVPEEDTAPLASCVAALGWQMGNGAIANVAAVYGLEVDPRNVLCKLVNDAVRQGVHPRVWLEMLQAMTLNDLRSGPRRRRHLRYRIDPVTQSKVRDCPG